MVAAFVLHSRLTHFLKGYGWLDFYLSAGVVVVRLAEKKKKKKFCAGASGLTATWVVLDTGWAWGPRWRQATQLL